MHQAQSTINQQAMDLKYRSSNSGQDEIYGADGKIKPYWKGLLSSMEQLGHADFIQKQSKSLRILRDDGATYNIYSDITETASTWSLDLVPSLINSEEWAGIEAGLLERAELFNLLLKDLYGPRELIRKGVIPPEALFAHPGFLRSCDGISLPGEQQLILHGIDMVRDASGDMCVITDRTQSPSGAGYALENRTVMSRVFPSLYRESQVHRLANFFHRLREKLNSMSPHQEQARIVVLTPGAHNETYFEHAYIANYLGLHLVQSGDLVVRNGYVWMKSLDGLSRVDVIFRRVDDWYCDPVELRGDSLLGVAGLLEIVRAGRVAVANPLGTGILESPIFLRYLPAIAKQLLGRDMRLKSIDTYWCGNKDDLAYIKDNFDDLVVKPVHRGKKEESVYTGSLSEKERKDFFEKIAANPLKYVAQPILSGSHLPTYDKGSIVPRPGVLRSFVTASDSSYAVMPGGLTRVGVEESEFYISSQTGSKSKDTWVIASEPLVIDKRVDQVSAHKEADLISLPSRVVENLFWMGRYAERVEASLRLLRTVFMMFNGEEPLSDEVKRILLSAVTRVTTTYPGFVDADKSLIDSPYDELLSVVIDKERPGSISANLNSMLYCADESKELVSSDTLRVINDIRDSLVDLQDTFASGMMTAPEEALDPLVTALMALSGLAHESMVRNVGWRFMQIGRRLERSIQTNTIISYVLGESVPEQDERLLISSSLLCLENLISYRRRYSAELNIKSCLDLIMLDTSNPRSLLFQLEHLYQHLTVLPQGDKKTNELKPEENLTLQAKTLVELAQLKELCLIKDEARPNLFDTLTNLNKLLESISNMITSKYFDHRESSQQLVRGKWE